MDTFNIALKSDIKLFSDFLDLLDISVIPPNVEEANSIFKHCSASIQQEYYNRYGKDIRIRYSAILNSTKVEIDKYTLDHIDDWYYITDPRLLSSGHIMVYTDILCCSGKYAKYITDDIVVGDVDVIGTNAFTCDEMEDIVSVISDNPNLSKYYTHELDVNFSRYNFEQLSILIKNGIVTYPDEIYPSRSLADLICSVREYIPDWMLDDIIWIDSETSLEEMDYCISHGLIPEDKLSTYDVGYEELLLLKNIRYLTDETIMLAYITEGFESLIPYIKPVSLSTAITFSNLDNIASLEDKYLSKLDLDLDLSDVTDLSEEDLIKLNVISNRCNVFDWDGSYDLHEAIILHQYIDKFEGVDYRLKYPEDMGSMLDTYDKGVNLVWKKHHTVPLCNILFCRHLQNYIPSLNPPMETKYYQFMDTKLLGKITNVNKFKSYSDISIMF